MQLWLFLGPVILSDGYAVMMNYKVDCDLWCNQFMEFYIILSSFLYKDIDSCMCVHMSNNCVYVQDDRWGM